VQRFGKLRFSCATTDDATGLVHFRSLRHTVETQRRTCRTVGEPNRAILRRNAVVGSGIHIEAIRLYDWFCDSNANEPQQSLREVTEKLCQHRGKPKQSLLFASVSVPHNSLTLS